MNPSESHSSQPHGMLPLLKRSLIALAIGIAVLAISGVITMSVGVAGGLIEFPVPGGPPADTQMFSPQMMRLGMGILTLMFVVASMIVFQTLGRDLELKTKWPFTTHEVVWGIVAILVDLASVFVLVEVFTDSRFLEMFQQLINSSYNWQLSLLDTVLLLAFPSVDVLFYQGLVQQYVTRVSSKTGGVIATTIAYGIVVSSPILAIVMIPRAIMYAQRNNLLAVIGTYIIVGFTSGTLLYFLL